MMVLLELCIVICGIIGGILMMCIALVCNDELSFMDAFVFAEYFYEEYNQQLNRAGLIIGITVISLFLLPGSVLTIVIVAAYKAAQKLFALFKYVFRRKDGTHE